MIALGAVAWATELKGLSAVSPNTPTPAATPARTECPATVPIRDAAPSALPNDSDPNQETGAASRSRQTETARNARTTSGSNWLPAHVASSWRALSGAIGRL